MSLLSFNVVTICIIHKILVMIKNHLNFCKDNIFKCFFKKYNRFSFFKKDYLFFFITNNVENPRPEKEKIIKDIRNHFRFKKELNHTAIKDIRNLFRLEKETKAIKDRIIRDIIFFSTNNSNN